MPPPNQPVVVEMRTPSAPEIEGWKGSGLGQPSQEILADAWKYVALSLYSAMNYNQYQAVSVSDLAFALLSPQLRLPLNPSVKSEGGQMSIIDPREFASEVEQLRALRSQVQDELFEVRKIRDTLQTLGPHVVMIREIDEKQAENEIVSYLQSHGHVDTGELVEKLGLDVDVVLNVVQHLKDQGKVERVDSPQP
ncbi:MAG: hypothetical protein WB643_07025 [Candidatus Bathyarchaeia archaeon]